MQPDLAVRITSSLRKNFWGAFFALKLLIPSPVSHTGKNIGVFFCQFVNMGDSDLQEALGKEEGTEVLYDLRNVVV